MNREDSAASSTVRNRPRARLVLFARPLAIVRAVVVATMVAVAAGLPTQQLAANDPEPGCGEGDEVLCVEIRYCLYFCWYKRLYTGEKEA